jgi:hypothetical protein
LDARGRVLRRDAGIGVAAGLGGSWSGVEALLEDGFGAKEFPALRGHGVACVADVALDCARHVLREGGVLEMAVDGRAHDLQRDALGQCPCWIEENVRPVDDDALVQAE